jgi:hypothetical protein
MRPVASGYGTPSGVKPKCGSGAVRPLNVVSAPIGTYASCLPAAFGRNKITLVTHNRIPEAFVITDEQGRAIETISFAVVLPEPFRK